MRPHLESRNRERSLDLTFMEQGVLERQTVPEEFSRSVVKRAGELDRRPRGNSAKSKEPAQGYALTVLSLPNMFTAGAVHGIRWCLLGQLLLADWARLGHYICHILAS